MVPPPLTVQKASAWVDVGHKRHEYLLVWWGVVVLGHNDSPDCQKNADRVHNVSNIRTSVCPRFVGVKLHCEVIGKALVPEVSNGELEKENKSPSIECIMDVPEKG